MSVFLIITIGLVLSIGTIVLAKYLNSKNLINSQDLQIASEILGLSTEIFLEFSKNKDENLIKICNIAKESIDLALNKNPQALAALQ